MKILKRYLYGQITKDLKKKMVLLGGPRQVGKTTLAKRILGQEKGYLNWDIAKDREKILTQEWPRTSLWVLDEFHKFKHWRNTLKGLYDEHHETQKILVTGSARLDYYRFGGDSLQGRYHYLRMHPLSVGELKIKTNKKLLELLRLGGFPEPFFSSSEIESKRWSREYRTRLIQDDLKALERIEDIGTMELLILRLPKLVGSPLSINALREDLQLSHKTITKWLKFLERLYAIFRLAPFGTPSIRAVKKEQKHYHFDWTLVQENSFRFENMIACHLLKHVHYRQDTLGEEIELRYFRDTDRREVDFIICKATDPLIAVECKWNDAELSRSLKYFRAKFPNCRCLQISATGEKDYLSKEGITVMPAVKFLSELI